MPPEKPQPTPFISRDQLKFQEGKMFSVSIETQSSLVATLTVRGFTKEGPFRFLHTTTSTGAVATSVFRLPDIPIFLSVIDQTALFYPGECRAVCKLIVDGVAHATLCDGLVNVLKGIAWPVPTDYPSAQGKGAAWVVTTANPNANVEISYTFVEPFAMKLKSLRFQLVTDANVANRTVHVVLTKANGVVIELLPSVAQAASLTKNYSAAPYGDNTSLNEDNDITINMPADIWIESGYIISTTTTNRQVGDNYGAMAIELEAFFM